MKRVPTVKTKFFYSPTLFVVMLSVTILRPMAAQAGPGLSGGGQGVVCRNLSGRVTSARLLDLAEAEQFFLLKLPTSSSQKSYIEIAKLFAAQLDQAVPTIEPTSELKTLENGVVVDRSIDVNIGLIMDRRDRKTPYTDRVLQIDREKMLMPGNDFRIAAVGDSTPRIQPANQSCQLEQIAVYTDGNQQVHIVSSVWNQLDNVNKAALLIHEALYRTLREMGDSNSDRTRKAVAYLFGGMKFTWPLQSVPNKFLSCWTNDTPSSFQFVVLPGDRRFVRAYFLVYNGEIMLTQTAATLDTGFFAQALGVDADPVGNLTTIREIKNPLIDLPTYDYVNRTDTVTGKVTAAIEAVGLSGGKNEKSITCNLRVSEVTFGAGGSIGMEHSAARR